MFITKKRLIINFVFIFLIGSITSYFGYNLKTDHSFLILSIAGLTIGYSILIPIKLLAEYLSDKE